VELIVSPQTVDLLQARDSLTGDGQITQITGELRKEAVVLTVILVVESQGRPMPVESFTFEDFMPVRGIGIDEDTSDLSTLLHCHGGKRINENRLSARMVLRFGNFHRYTPGRSLIDTTDELGLIDSSKLKLIMSGRPQHEGEGPNPANITGNEVALTGSGDGKNAGVESSPIQRKAIIRTGYKAAPKQENEQGDAWDHGATLTVCWNMIARTPGYRVSLMIIAIGDRENYL